MKRLILALVLACASAGALAHRFHTGIAELSFNDRTGSVEVVHTYMAHDIDAVLAELHGRPVDLGQRAGEALLRQYIERHFYLLGADKRRIALKWVGITVSVDSVVIYQEAEGTTLPALAAMHNEVLVGFLPRQANTVNVRQDGQIRSLTFDRKYPERPLK